MTFPVDFTHLSKRNSTFPRVSVHVANGAEFVALGLTKAEMHRAANVLYLHVHRESGKCYVGVTVQEAAKRWFVGPAYKQNRRFGDALKKHGWTAFDSYVLAFAEDREVLNAAEVAAIAVAGGHKSKWTYNLSPGGDLVAENDKPIIGVYLPTGEQRIFKSGSDAARHLQIPNVDAPNSEARGEETSVKGWWFRYENDQVALPPTKWGESLRVDAVRAARSKKVIGLNLANRDTETFESTAAAARALGLLQSMVSEVATGKQRSTGGWWFKFDGDGREPPTIYGQIAGRLIRDRKVYAHNLQTREVREFRNGTVAANQLALSQSSISAMTRGVQTSVGGWWFTYDPDGVAPTQYKGALVAKARSKAVIATELATGAETTFSSAKEAAAALLMSRATISFNISGKLKSAKGYSFRFA